MRPFLTLHHPAAARRYYAEGLWREDTFYSLLFRHAGERPQVQILKRGCRPKERPRQIPVLVACIQEESESQARTPCHGGRKCSPGAPLLIVPAQKRSHIPRRAGQIVKLRIYGFVEHPAKQGYRSHERPVAPSGMFRRPDRGVVAFFRQWLHFHLFPHKHAEVFETRFRRPERVESQHGWRGKRNRSFAQLVVQMWWRIEVHRREPRLLDRVPIFQRCFEVSVEEKQSAQELPRIRIFRIQAQSRAQIGPRARNIVQTVGNARALDQEPCVARRFPVARREIFARLLPALEMGQRHPRKVIKFRWLVRRALRQARHFLPFFFFV